MAELLTIINPNSSNRTAGDVVVVKEDGWEWSDFERKQFAIVRVPMTVEEAESVYLKSGIPDEVANAHAEAVNNFRANPTEKNRAAMDEAFYKPSDYPDKQYNLNITALPTEVLDIVQETKEAIELFSLITKEAARQKVEEELVKIDGELLPENLELHTHQLFQVYEENVGDAAKESLIAASREGSMEILKPLLDSIPTPPVVEKTIPELILMTVNKKYDF